MALLAFFTSPFVYPLLSLPLLWLCLSCVAWVSPSIIVILLLLVVFKNLLSFLLLLVLLFLFLNFLWPSFLQKDKP